VHAGRLLVVCSAKKRKPAESDNNKASEAEFVEVSKRRITRAAVGGMSVRQQLYAVRAVKKMTVHAAQPSLFPNDEKRTSGGLAQRRYLPGFH
jgi:hypothetical protein